MTERILSVLFENDICSEKQERQQQNRKNSGDGLAEKSVSPNPPVFVDLVPLRKHPIFEYAAPVTKALIKGFGELPNKGLNEK